jgi:hypothetical protein
MNSYVVSANGFYAGYVMDDEHKKIIQWATRIRDARPLNNKNARQLIDKFNLDAWVWNPFAEEPIKDKYEVVQRTYSSWYNNGEKEPAVLEWIARKVVMQSKTDARFLYDRDKKYDHYSMEEAEKIALEKNMAMYNELSEKLKHAQAQIAKVSEFKMDENF